jgi:hypothetical protein
MIRRKNDSGSIIMAEPPIGDFGQQRPAVRSDDKKSKVLEGGSK